LVLPKHRRNRIFRVAMPFFDRSFRLSLLAAVACTALLTGCATKNEPTTTGSIDRSSPALDQAKALAKAGRNEEALKALAKIRDRKPDWRAYNLEGTILDQMGRTDEAQRRYYAALAIVPQDAGVLSNLGLSLALSQKPAEAETVLRRAAAMPTATPKVRQNLALVLALQGKYTEAEELARRDLPPDQAAANLKYWKTLRPTAKAQAPAHKPRKPQKPIETGSLDLR
jgi:Flp pilus assembly protein TadD